MQRRTLVAAAMLAPSAVLSHGTKKNSAAHPPLRLQQKDWGIAAEATGAQRTIVIRMLDTMRFEPAQLDVKLGETVRLTLRNSGRMLHEFVIGTAKELRDHAALMQKFPDMEHDEPYMLHVSPGKTGQIVWHFNRRGTFEFACLIAGHYQAGMKGVIHVR